MNKISAQVGDPETPSPGNRAVGSPVTSNNLGKSLNSPPPFNSTNNKPAPPIATKPQLGQQQSFNPSLSAKPVTNPIHQFGKDFFNTASASTSPEGQQAIKHYGTATNDDVPYTDPSKFDAIDKLREYMKSDPGAQKLPQYIKDKANEQFSQLDGPMGQAARYGAPILRHLASSPEMFAQTLGLPGISDVAKPAIGALGLPGLMAAYSYASGDSEKWKNWRTLTSGLRDPNNPRRLEIQKGLDQFTANDLSNFSGASGPEDHDTSNKAAGCISGYTNLDSLIDNYLLYFRLRS